MIYPSVTDCGSACDDRIHMVGYNALSFFSFSFFKIPRRQAKYTFNDTRF